MLKCKTVQIEERECFVKKNISEIIKLPDRKKSFLQRTHEFLEISTVP